jgi:hypothetical protein
MNSPHRWSTAVIPFRMGPLADGVDPIKIYEYLAFGLPVVSFRMPQISDYPYTITVDSVGAFCDALRQGLRDGNRQRGHRRIPCSQHLGSSRESVASRDDLGYSNDHRNRAFPAMEPVTWCEVRAGGALADMP